MSTVALSRGNPVKRMKSEFTSAITLNRVAQTVPAASCGSVSLPARTPGGTPGELAGGDARATSHAGLGPRSEILKSPRFTLNRKVGRVTPCAPFTECVACSVAHGVACPTTALLRSSRGDEARSVFYQRSTFNSQPISQSLLTSAATKERSMERASVSRKLTRP